MNRAIKKLLSIEPKALKELHNTFNIDWNKPYRAVKIDGNTTINKILKAIDAQPNDLILVLNWQAYGCLSERFHIGILNYLGGLVVKNGYHSYYFHCDKLDNYYCKGDFREHLKYSDVSPYHIVIAVNKADLTPYKSTSVDFSKRYRYVKHENGRYYNSNKEYVSRVYFEDINANGAKIDYIPHHDKADISRIIDKSGYLIEESISNLHQRAKALKSEREKAAYLATDNTAKVEELRLRIKAKKIELIERLKVADTAETIKQVSKALETWGSGLTAIQESFERMERAIKEQRYSSIDDFNRHYEQINKMLLDNGRS